MAPKGKYIAFVSAEVETENPEAELEPGLALLGHIDEKIIDMYDMYEPVNDSSLDNCFISKVPPILLDPFEALASSGRGTLQLSSLHCTVSTCPRPSFVALKSWNIVYINPVAFICVGVCSWYCFHV